MQHACQAPEFFSTEAHSDAPPRQVDKAMPTGRDEMLVIELG
jgi:hypothetical protein